MDQLAAVSPWGLPPVGVTTTAPLPAAGSPLGLSSLAGTFNADFFSSPIFGALLILGAVVYFDGRLLPAKG